jgi:hypothetical protein
MMSQVLFYVSLGPIVWLWFPNDVLDMLCFIPLHPHVHFFIGNSQHSRDCKYLMSNHIIDQLSLISQFMN